MFISRRKNTSIYHIGMISADLCMLYFSILLAAVVRFGITGAISYIHSRIFFLPVNFIIFISIFYLCGLYEFRRFNSYTKIILTVFVAVFLGVLFNFFIFYAGFTLASGRALFALLTFFIFMFVSLTRVVCFFTIQKKIFNRNVIVIGSKGGIDDVLDLLKKHKTSFYTIKGIINDDKNIDDNIRGYPILGGLDSVENYITKRKIDGVIVTSLEPVRHTILKKLRVCRYHGIEVIDLVSLYEELEGQVPLKYIDDEWLFSSLVTYQSFHTRNLKRFVDVIGAIIGLIVLFPVSLLVIVLIKCTSRGPVLYRQKRVGHYGKNFRVLKFRSMIHRAERGVGPVWSANKDPRITPVGKWLRKTRIDEIPQLINILLGDMSLVGPRPERPAFVKELSEKFPFYLERLYVQPGLTGWAQINYPYTSTIEDSKIKLQYDLYYIKHISFLLDCLILLKTATIVVFSKGR